MRLFWMGLLFFGMPLPVFSAYQQELIPVIRDISTSSAPSVSEWKTYVRIADYGGASYVSLVQVAELLNGRLRWHSASKTVDLSLHHQTIRFAYNSTRAWINTKSRTLEKSTVKNSDGFWVPTSFFASQPFYKATGCKLEWPPGGRTQQHEGSPTATSGMTTTKASAPAVVHAIKRIVIDPGHGGKDPGAVSAHGLEEKAVNLFLAEELSDVLRQDYNYEVLLTRMDDTFVPLEARAQLANRQNADLFVSIHCNASLSPKLKGFEVYFLSEQASDPHADAVARFENAPLSLEGKTAPSPSQVKKVLRSLVKNANINEASTLGAFVDRDLGKKLSEPSLGVKQAAFYVLRGAEMPAILIETGFLSNGDEERLLQDNAFRKKIVDGIAAGIVAYDEQKQKDRR